MEKPPAFLKWGIVTVLGLAAAAVIVPYAAHLVWSTVSLLAGLGVIAGMAFVLPAAGEWMGQLGYWLWDKAIRSNPVIKFEREIEAFAHEINSFEANCSKAKAARMQMESLFDQQKNVLDSVDRLQWQNDIESLLADEKDVYQVRDDMMVELDGMKKEGKKLSANWQLAIARGKVASALDKANGIGEGRAGVRVATDEVRKRLAASRARLEDAKSRRTIGKAIRDANKLAERNGAVAQITDQTNVIEAQVRVVPTPAPASAVNVVPAYDARSNNVLDKLRQIK